MDKLAVLIQLRRQAALGLIDTNRPGYLFLADEKTMHDAFKIDPSLAEARGDVASFANASIRYKLRNRNGSLSYNTYTARPMRIAMAIL